MKINKFPISPEVDRTQVTMIEDYPVSLFTIDQKCALLALARQDIGNGEHMVAPVAGATFSVAHCNGALVAYDLDVVCTDQLYKEGVADPARSRLTLAVLDVLFNDDTFSVWITATAAYNSHMWRKYILERCKHKVFLVDSEGIPYLIESASEHQDWLERKVWPHFDNGLERMPRGTLAVSRSIPSAARPLSEFPLPIRRNRWISTTMHALTQP